MILTKAQIRALTILLDGEWKTASTRSSYVGVLCSNTSWRLYEKGLVNRRGISKLIKPQGKGYEYQITQKGRDILAEHVNQ